MLRRWGAALALLCFVALQAASLGHSASAEVLAPGHDRSECAFCVANDRAAPPPVAFEPLLPAVAFASVEAPAPVEAIGSYDVAALPPARGPPSL